MTVVGAGAVGMASVTAILFQHISSDVTLIEMHENRLKGELLDLQHGSAFLNAWVEGSTDLEASAGSRVVVVTAGAKQEPEQSRLDLVKSNVKVFKALIPKLAEYSPEAIFMIVTNPCDIMTHVAWQLSCLPRNQVLGSGTNLDSARFKYLISKRLGVHPASCYGWIIGEHGDTCVPVWSDTNIAGVLLADINPQVGTAEDKEHWSHLHKAVVRSAYEVIKLKGYTNWAVGLSVACLTNAILTNKHDIYPVSTFVQGQHGIEHDVCLSLPCVLGEQGVVSIIKQKLTDHERKQLQASAETMAKIHADLKV